MSIKLHAKFPGKQEWKTRFFLSISFFKAANETILFVNNLIRCVK